MTKLTKESAPNDEQKRAKWSLTIPFYFSVAHHFVSDLQLCMLRGALHHPTVALRHPTVALRHPTVALRHPIVALRHPIVALRHPIVALRHPIGALRHPAVALRHLAVALRHPTVALHHPAVALRMFRPISIGLPHPHRRRHPCPGALCAQNTVLPQLLP
jgi:hypothetical protein